MMFDLERYIGKEPSGYVRSLTQGITLRHVVDFILEICRVQKLYKHHKTWSFGVEKKRVVAV